MAQKYNRRHFQQHMEHTTGEWRRASCQELWNCNEKTINPGRQQQKPKIGKIRFRWFQEDGK